MATKLLAALALVAALVSPARAQSSVGSVVPGSAFKANASTLPSSCVGSQCLYADSANSNRWTVHQGGVDYDLLNCASCTGNANTIQGNPIASGTPTLFEGLVWNGSAWQPQAIVNSITGTSGQIAVTPLTTGNVSVGLATTMVTAGSYGSSTQVPSYTVDSYGRFTAASNVSIASTTFTVSGPITGGGSAGPGGSVGFGCATCVVTTDPRLLPSPGTNGNGLVDNGAAWTSQPPQNFDVRNYASFAAAVAFIGSTPATLAISNTQNVTTTISVPSTLALLFNGAGQLNVSSGQTVTIGGPVQAPLQQIFAGAGHVYFSSVTGIREDYPQWFGALANNSHDDTTAIQASLDALRDTGGHDHFTTGTYLISAAINLIASSSHPYNNVILEGDGWGSVIKWSQTITSTAAPFGSIYFDGTSSAAMTGSGIDKLRVSGFDDLSHSATVLIQLDNVNGWSMTNTEIDTNRNSGVASEDPRRATNVVIKNNYAHNIGGWDDTNTGFFNLAAYNLNANNLQIVGNVALNCGLAIEQTGSGGIIDGNDFENFGFNGGSSVVYEPAISLSSTFPGNKMIVSNNTVRYSSVAVQVAESTGEILVENNIFEFNDSGVAISSTSTASVVRNNYFFDTTGGSSGEAMFNSGSVGILWENNVIVRGATAWAYVYYSNNATLNDIVRNNVVVGNAATTSYFTSANSSNTTLEFINNEFRGTSSGANFYVWRGTNITSTIASGIAARATIISTAEPSLLLGTAAPASGTWSQGDVFKNPSPSLGGCKAWVNTTAGTPGTWTCDPTSITVSGSGLQISTGQISFANQSANTFLRGPTSGGSGATTWGALVAADLPLMGGATSSTAGTVGAVAAPTAGQQNYFWRGDGTWALVTGTGTVTQLQPADTTLNFSPNPITTTGSIGVNQGNAFAWTIAGVGATKTVHQSWSNTTAAASGAQQYSGLNAQCGNGWGTTLGTSQAVCWATRLETTQGTAPTGVWGWYESVNGGAYAAKWTFSDNGLITSQVSTDTINMGANSITYTATVSGAARAHIFADNNAFSTTGAVVGTFSDNSATGEVAVGINTGVQHVLAETGANMTCSGTCTANEVACYNGSGTVGNCAATANLTTIAGVFATSGTSGNVIVAHTGLVQVNCDTGVAFGNLVGTSSATAGNVSASTPGAGAIVGRAATSQAAGVCQVMLGF